LANDFVGDDKDQLLGNPVVTGHRITQAISTGVWAFRHANTNYYRPLQILVYMLFHAVFGFHAVPFHLFSVLLHAVNSVLVYRLGSQITGRPRAALASALLFAVHPIHTEVVDWIAAYPDLMVTSILLFGMWRFTRQKGPLRPLAIAGYSGIYLAALATKETGVMLPLLFLAYERICLSRRLPELKRKLPLYYAMLAVLGIYLVARRWALGSLAPAEHLFFQLTPLEFASSVVVIAAQYAGKLIFPGGLNFFHVFHPTMGFSLEFWIALAVLAAVAAAAVWRRTPAAMTFGIVWTALCLAPALNLTGVGQNVFAERYLYLPSAGFAWMAGLAWAWSAERHAAAAWAAGIAILCASSWQTLLRNADWRDDLTMLRKTVAQSPDAGIVHNNLAGLYVHRDEFDLALEQEREAVRCEPRSEIFHKQFGMLLELRDPRGAAREFEIASRLDPSDAEARNLLQEALQLARSQPR
jgi:hypothetical protein